MQDTSPPTIELQGSVTVTHFVGSVYVDDGAVAHDDVDGALPVESTGSVNSFQLGDYELTYSAMDRSGNRSETLTRTVMVSDGLSIGDLILTSE